MLCLLKVSRLVEREEQGGQEGEKARAGEASQGSRTREAAEGGGAQGLPPMASACFQGSVSTRISYREIAPMLGVSSHVAVLPSFLSSLPRLGSCPVVASPRMTKLVAEAEHDGIEIIQRHKRRCFGF